jgi:hypothetical protein
MRARFRHFCSWLHHSQDLVADIWSCYFLGTTNCSLAPSARIQFPSIQEQLGTLSHYVIPEPYAGLIGTSKNSEGASILR